MDRVGFRNGQSRSRWRKEKPYTVLVTVRESVCMGLDEGIN